MTLKLNGYSTAQFGKCHEIPVWETSPMGPFDQWPTGDGGFEYFYGFLGGETNQWYPAIYEGTSPIDSRRQSKRVITSRRHDGPGDQMGAPTESAHARQAVLYVFRSRRNSRAPSGTQGMDRQDTRASSARDGISCAKRLLSVRRNWV